MRRFASLADAGHRLAPLVVESMDAVEAPGDPVIVLAAIPNGVPVALPVAAALGVRAIPLPVERTESGPRIPAVPEVTGRRVVVVDDGVETGSVARAAAEAVRAHRPAGLVPAVPVCSHEAMADLAGRYDRIIAVHTPFGRRALAWHFDDFDTIDDAEAHRRLADS